jgi:hypothetical protein
MVTVDRLKKDQQNLACVDAVDMVRFRGDEIICVEGKDCAFLTGQRDS